MFHRGQISVIMWFTISTVLLHCSANIKFNPAPLRSNDQIFYGDIAQALTHMINKADNELKIFVYPVPPLALSLSQQLFSEFECPILYRAEYMIVDYIKSSSLLTHAPEKADFFMIPHNISCLMALGRTKIKSGDDNGSLDKWISHHIAKQHIAPIWHSIMNEYPYFNSSGGRDHLFISSFRDLAYNPPLSLLPFLNLLVNATCVTSASTSQRDIITTSSHSIVKSTKLISRNHNLDILIPPYHHWIPYTEHEAVNISRKYDIIYKGAFIKDSSSVMVHFLKMSQDDMVNFRYYSSDSPSLSVSYAYFSLCPFESSADSSSSSYLASSCIFEALLGNTIPVILSDEKVVLPFEKIINWSSIVLNIDTGIVMKEPNRTKLLRNAIFRSLHLKGTEHRQFIDGKMGRHVSAIHHKLKHMPEASQWLHWGISNGSLVDEADPQKNIWKLMTLELFCRAWTTGIKRSREVNENDITRLSHTLAFCMKHEK